MAGEDLFLDQALAVWVLFPIMTVMFLVGILRHYVTVLLSSAPKVDPKAIRENQAMLRGRLLRGNGNHLHRQAFMSRKEYLSEKYLTTDFLKNPKATGAPNPMDAGSMDAMMDGMKKNMAMFVPQTIIMTWITFFFSGFVLIKLPFPLTLRFKAMLQRGIETSEMDVAWVSSLSWYFLNLFGLGSIFKLFLGEENGADSMRDVQAMGMMAAPAPGQVDMAKLFKTEKENLDLFVYEWDLANVEERLLKTSNASSTRKAPKESTKIHRGKKTD